MTDVIRFQITADDKGSEKFKKFNNVLKSGFSVAKTLGKATLGTATAVTAFTAVVAKHNDIQGKFADRINKNVAELTAYQHVADLAGLSTQTFNMATQRMTRRVAEASQGLGEAQGALKELGIDARTFKGLGLEEQMSTLADAMNETADENDKLRLAFKLFDSEGTAMLQMLNSGSDAMKEAANDAKFLGLVIDNEAAAKAALFNDKMTRATGSVKGLSNGIASELMPLISGLADNFADFVANNRTNIVQFIKDSTVGVFTVGQVFSQVFDQIGNILTDPKAFTDFIVSLHDTAVKVGVLALDMGQVIARGIYEGIAIGKDLFLGFGRWIGESIAKLVTGQETDTIGESLARVFTDGLAKARESVASSMTDIASIVSEHAPSIGESLADAFGVDMEAAKSNAISVIEGLSLFADATKDAIKSTEESTTSFMATVQQQKTAFTDWLKESNTQFIESFRMTAQGAIDSLSTGIAQAIMDGTSLVQAFKNIAKQVATQIIASFIKLGIQRLILGKIMGTAVATEASQGAAKAVGLAGANMFASMAAAPFPLNLTAPAAAASAMAGASASFTAGAATGAALGAGIGLVAHGGLTNNPEEQTALIHRKERIISPRQNDDLTSFLDNPSVGGSAVIENLNITMFPNATNADAVFNMTADELADSFGATIVDALDSLNRRGIRPEYSEN